MGPSFFPGIIIACVLPHIGCSLAAQIPRSYNLKRGTPEAAKTSTQSSNSLLWKSSRDGRIVLPVENPTVDGVEATLSWENMAKGDRLGSSFVLKKGEKFVEYAVLYKPRDSSFVVRGLLDATGYMGELRVLRNKEALTKINSTAVVDSTIFKLDTPRIISGSESEMILSVLTTLPPSSVRLESVSVDFNIPKQKEDALLEVSDLAQNNTRKAVIHVVPNTVSVVVNDLPAQTVVKITMKSAAGKSTKPINTMYLFTGSVTNIGEKVPQVSATATRLGLLNNVQRRPTVTCYVKNKPPFQGFPCHESNVCIPLHWECDGEEDCDGGFDEKGCQGGLSAYTRQYLNKPNNFQQSGRCKRGEFECQSRGVNVCLPNNWLCDGRRDCTNGYDENQANCNGNGWGYPNSGNNYHLVYNPLQCGRSQFRCRKGGCVSMRMLCDGRRDCRDGSDEDDCPEDEGTDIDEEIYTPDNCDPDYEYVCSGLKKKCVPRPWVCDDEDDCPGGEDESDDLCNNHFHNFND